MNFARVRGARQPVLLAALLGICALVFCPFSHSQSAIAADSDTGSTANFQRAPEADPAEAITVGPRAAVGTDTVGEKAAEGVVSGVLGSVFGGRDSAPKSDRPDTERDPTRKIDYAEIEAMDGGLQTGARGQWTEGGLLVSTRINDAPGQGTFQAVFLQACNGPRFYPGRYEIYKLWPERGVSIGWSRGTMRDGEVIEQDSGRISGQWDDGVSHDELSTGPSTWRQLGFDRAHHGARQIGAYFDISPDALAALEEVRLFVHTTLPSRDPVTTAASVWTIAPGAGESVVLGVPEEQPDSWWGRCRAAFPVHLASGSGVFWGAFALVGAAAKIPVHAPAGETGTTHRRETDKER